MESISGRRETFLRRLALCCAAVIVLLSLASATENGATVFPVGVETVMTGLQPHPGQTMFYEYTCFYEANELDNSKGEKLPIDFKLRIFATAIKINHTWDFKLFGGHFNTNIAIPIIYQQLHVPSAAAPKNSKYAIGNIDIVPFGVNYHTGIAHWYYEVNVFLPGTGYSKNDALDHGLNIGQHNLAIGPVFGFTLLPNKGKTEISTRNTYLINGYDKDTNYHGGNEFFTEFNVDQMIAKKVALGINGAFYQQVTDDHQFGALVNGDGNKGRDLQIGPQIRVNIPHGGFAFKYYRDTLVENKPRGNAFWFQIAVPFAGLSKPNEPGH
jgi:hypothetical protein